MEQAHLKVLAHDSVEVVSELWYMLPLLLRKQPGGKYDDEMVSPLSTTTSLQPNPTATFSHSLILVIELPPARLEHCPLVFS
jgi:hypothetical protein